MLHSMPPDLTQARLRHHLEMQSLVIEETVGQYLPRPLPVLGGDVRVDRIWYEMPGDEMAGTLVVPMRAVEDELRRRLGAAAQVSRWTGGLRVAVERPSPPVDLWALMQQYGVPEKGRATAVLGLDDSGRPIQLDLPRIGHILVSGDAGSGKTSLLQTIAASLVMSNRPGQLQFLVIQNLADSGLRLLDGLPHDYLLRPVVTTAVSAVQALSALAGRMESLPGVVGKRAAVGKGPHLVILIDAIETLLAVANFAALAPIVRLLGAVSTVSIIVSTRQPQNDLLQYCSDRWGARIVGRAADGAQANQLLGEGAFLLLHQGAQSSRYFQGAYVDRYDLSFLKMMPNE